MTRSIRPGMRRRHSNFWLAGGLLAAISAGASLVYVQASSQGVADSVANAPTLTQTHQALKLSRREPEPLSGQEPEPLSGQEKAALRSQLSQNGILYSKQLSELVLDCWNTKKEPTSYAGQDVVNLTLLIPTTADSETEFDFCVESLRLGEERVVWTENGWVDSKENAALGLNGYWFAFSDGHTQWATHDGRPRLAGAVPEGAMCIKGTAPRVRDGKYAEYWGAGVGLRFAGSGEQALLYRPKFGAIEVFLSGKVIPRLLRLALDDEANGIGSGQHWCTNLASTDPASAN